MRVLERTETKGRDIVYTHISYLRKHEHSRICTQSHTRVCVCVVYILLSLLSCKHGYVCVLYIFFYPYYHAHTGMCVCCIFFYYYYHTLNTTKMPTVARRQRRPRASRRGRRARATERPAAAARARSHNSLEQRRRTPPSVLHSFSRVINPFNQTHVFVSLIYCAEHYPSANGRRAHCRSCIWASGYEGIYDALGRERCPPALP